MNRWLMLLCLAFVAARSDSEHPRLYNQGVTAYRTNDFSAALQQFEQASPSTDRALQQRAFYNLGNTCYRLGEAQPQQARELWQRAIKSYESASALDPADADAKFNTAFVKKKLEELEKQQQQQNQQQNQDQQKQNQQQDQKKDDQQQQKDQQNQQDQQKQDKQQQDKQNQQQDKDKQDQKDKQNQQDRQSKDKQGDKDKQQQQLGQPDKLDKQQAKALLDNLREDEQNWNFFPEVQMKDLKHSGKTEKDW